MTSHMSLSICCQVTQHKKFYVMSTLTLNCWNNLILGLQGICRRPSQHGQCMDWDCSNELSRWHRKYSWQHSIKSMYTYKNHRAFVTGNQGIFLSFARFWHTRERLSWATLHESISWINTVSNPGVMAMRLVQRCGHSFWPSVYQYMDARTRKPSLTRQNKIE